MYYCTGTSFLTGDDVADAVLEYAWVLAQYGRFDLVRVPTRRDDGSRGSSTLLVGPSSQISSEDVTPAEAGTELVAREFVQGIKERAAHLREPLPAEAFDGSMFGSETDDLT
ncbi:MAG TPA: hypothetical protein VGO26_11295 [Amnibacterium sp.]|nr:hypothetical protein [Amnibacterium sp.]